ncbi:MAG TPA: two-component regulator propeller domain-containing protein [Blastocatellia bacterium]|nr:two-component regulator propeller domain-containing protein [Blastocatellia bacterium]
MRRTQIKRFILFCSVLLTSLTLNAPSNAERPPYKAYTTADGLAHDSVNKIHCDSRGFLWFCTAEGLSRFDGYRFKNYGQEQGLPHRNINDFLETRDGTYFVATSSGLAIFNPNGKAYRWNFFEQKLEQTSDEPPLFQTIFPDEGLFKQPRRNILCLAQDNGGRIWAGTGSGLFQVERGANGWELHEFGVAEWKDKGFGFADLLPDSEGGLLAVSSAIYRISPDGDIKKLCDDASSSIVMDREGRLWMDAYPALKLFAYENNSMRLLRTFTQKDGLPPNAIHFRTAQTLEGRIFVGYEYGLSEYLPNAKENEAQFHFLAREKINGFALDAAGNLWAATDSRGAWKVSLSGFTLFDSQDGVRPSDEIMSVFSDRKGEVFIASRPNQLSHFTGGKFETLVPFGLTTRSWGWHYLDSISRDGEWWIPGQLGLRRYPKLSNFNDLVRAQPKRIYTQADGLFADEIFNLFEDSRGDIWFTVIGPMEDTLLRWERNTEKIFGYTTADGLPAHNGPISFTEDSHGQMWFGYYFGGLARYNNGAFRWFTEKDGLAASQVGDLLTDSEGRLWVATAGRGLFRVDNTLDDHPLFASLSTANGLSSNQTSCLTEDRFGRIYVGTGRGINRVDRDGKIRVFTQEDGLPTNLITRCAADKNGALWFVVSNTLVRFVPEIERRGAPPPVFIDRILVNGVSQKISELGETEIRPLEFGSSQHQIQVDFFALTFGAGENVRYQYRLDDQDWSNPDRQQSLNLDLASGKHSLLIRAVRADGTASERPASVSFRILSPVWLRWWFLTIAVTVIGLAAYAAYRYRVARLLEIERVRTRIATDLHDDIGAGLSRMAVLSEVVKRQTRADHKESVDMLTDIADSARGLVDSMSDIVWSIDPRKDDLNNVASRIRQFASDVLEARGIDWEFKATEEIGNIKLPPEQRRHLYLIFKEAINNVARHSACSRVTLEISISHDRLIGSIRDDGRGFAVQSGDGIPGNGRGGNGLKNMQARAVELGGRLEIVSKPGSGTQLSLEIPLKGHVVKNDA